MQAKAILPSAPDVQPFRERYRDEMNCQIVHDSIHQRAGWTLTYRVESGGTAGTLTAVSANFDEFRLGGTWKSVTSGAVVPEPTTGVLAGLGAIGLALSGRRQKGR